MRINNNLMAMNTHRQLGINSGNGAKAIEKLSSGYRINRAGDDAAGLAISEKMRAQIRGLNQASRNSQDAISLVQTAEGALNESQAILQRMRELAVQSANDTNVDSDRSEIQKEINQLTSEINRIGNTTEFNTQKLLNGGEARSGKINASEDTAGNPSSGTATGAVTGVNEATASVAAGTAAITGFDKITSSSVAASGGSIGSPLTQVTQSVKGGTGAITGDDGVEYTAGADGAAIANGSVSNITNGGSGGPLAFTIDFNAEESNIKDGDGIEIGGKMYTAGTAAEVAAGDADFEVGADNNATIDNLATVLDGDAGIVDEDGNNVTVTGNGDGTVTFAVDANDKDMVLNGNTLADDTAAANDIATQIETGAVAAVYTLEVTENFTVGDSIKIGDQTFTAVADGDGNTGNQFEVGSDIATTVANLKAAFNQNTTLKDDYTADNDSPDWASDDNSLTIRKNDAGTDATAAKYVADVDVTKVATTAGEYKFEIATNFDVGEKFEIDGQIFTAVKAGDGNNGTQFEVGADFNATAANLKAALEANTAIGNEFTVAIGSGVNADTITLTEKAASGKSMNDVVGNVRDIDVAASKGKYSVEITKNFSKGDTLTIDGKVFTAVESGATGNEFNIGASIDATMTNLVSAIDNEGTYDATKGNTTFGTGNKLTIEERTASGDDLASADVTATKIAAVKGVYEFQITDQFSAGDRIAIDGIGLVAGDHFAIGNDVNATTANIKAAIEANDDLNDKFTVSVTDNQLTLTEKSASGTALTNPTVSRNAVAGEYSFTLSEQSKGSSIEIDGEKLTFATGGTGVESAAELKTLIEGNVTLNGKYEVEVDDAEIKLTQKTGQENATGPEVKYTIAAGSGFNATMQIGANTGQSMNVTMGDMRADSLDVSSADGAPQSVKVDGKDLDVAWTETKTVTSGTEDVGTEFALDVSSSKNATVAVTVINNAINQVSGERSKLGAFQNRLEHTIKNLDTSAENLQASESRIRDVDMAKEMMTFTKNNILQQAAQSMLAQANQAPQGVLQLLR